MRKENSRFLSIVLALLGAAVILCVAAFCFYMVWEKAPELEPQAPETRNLISEERQETVESLPFDTQRQDGVYTLLLVGNDDGTGNTDTIVVGKIDTLQHKMDFVSIPRDTLINVDWSVRKINSVYWGSKNSGGSGIDALSMHVRKLTGFDTDCYAVIDLGVFVDVIDALGGVDFDVPLPMHYEDASQNLYINLEPGPQHLDGYQAMGLCRFRHGYSNGDYGRIEMQQQFLKACAGQFISLGSIPNISKVVKLLAEGMDTNLSAANIAFFLRQALQCSPEDISFHTVPGDSALIYGLSYAVTDIDAWLSMVNEYLNPYDTPIGYGNVDIVYRSGEGYAATTELRGEWYYQSPEEPEELPQEEENTEEPETEPQEGENTEEPQGPTIIVVPSPSPQPEPESPGEPEETPQEENGEAPEDGVFA